MHQKLPSNSTVVKKKKKKKKKPVKTSHSFVFQQTLPQATKMGLNHLAVHINQHPQLVQNHLLHNIRVIVDGYNLLNHLCIQQINHGPYGGEYQAIADRCQAFFTNLKACNIWPFVVFNGASDFSKMNQQSSMESHQRRIHLAGRVTHSNTSQSPSIMPVFAVEVLQKILRDLDIPFAVSDFKAGNEIVGLANAWICPVLGKDPYYFLMDIKAGFLPLEHLQWHQVEYNANQHALTALKCKRYLLSKFCVNFKFDKEIIPLLVSMLETSPAATTQKKSSSNYFTHNFDPRDVNNICNRLAGHRTISNAITKLLPHLRMDQRIQIQDNIQAIVESLKPSSASNLAAYFTDKTLTTHPTLVSETSFLPQWCYRFFREGLLPNTVINAIRTKQVFTLVQAEDDSLPSSNDISRRLRLTLYGVLLPPGSLQNDHITTVTEYDRNGSKTTCNEVIPLTDIPNYGKVLHIRNMGKVTVAKRRRFLLTILGVKTNHFASLLGAIPPILQFKVCVVIYWFTNSWSATDNHVRAILTSWILGIAKQKVLQKGNQKCHPQISSIKDDPLQLMEWEPQEAPGLLDKFTKYIEPTFKTCPKETMYCFNQLQSCMKAALHLNAVLQHSFPTPDISVFYNVNLIHGICSILCGLSDGSQDKWLETHLFARAPTAWALFKVSAGYIHMQTDVSINQIDHNASPDDADPSPTNSLPDSTTDGYQENLNTNSPVTSHTRSSPTNSTSAIDLTYTQDEVCRFNSPQTRVSDLGVGKQVESHEGETLNYPVVSPTRSTPAIKLTYIQDELCRSNDPHTINADLKTRLDFNTGKHIQGHGGETPNTNYPVTSSTCSTSAIKLAYIQDELCRLNGLQTINADLKTRVLDFGNGKHIDGLEGETPKTTNLVNSPKRSTPATKLTYTREELCRLNGPHTINTDLKTGLSDLGIGKHTEGHRCQTPKTNNLVNSPTRSTLVIKHTYTRNELCRLNGPYTINADLKAKLSDLDIGKHAEGHEGETSNTKYPVTSPKRSTPAIQFTYTRDKLCRLNGPHPINADLKTRLTDLGIGKYTEGHKGGSSNSDYPITLPKRSQPAIKLTYTREELCRLNGPHPINADLKTRLSYLGIERHVGGHKGKT